MKNKTNDYLKNDKKAIGLNVIWSGLAVLINLIINFTVVPFVTSNIGIEAYGFVSLANTFTTYIDIVSIALNSFVSRYVSIAYHKNEKEKANEYFSSAIFSNMVLSVILFVISTVVIFNLNTIITIPQNLITEVKILFTLSIVNYLVTILQTAFNVSTFITNRLDLQTNRKCVSLLIKAFAIFIMFKMLKPHVWYVAIGALLMTLYFFIENYKFTIKLTPELVFRIHNVKSIRIIKLIKSGIWNAINNMGNILNSGLDLLIANKMLSAIAMGQISIAKDLGVMFYSLISIIANSFKPIQTRYYAANDVNNLVKQLKLSMKFTGVVCCVVLTVFGGIGDSFVSIWLHNRDDTMLIFRLIMVVLLSDVAPAVVSPLYYVYTLTNRLKFPCFITILMGATNVASMFILLKYTDLGGFAVVLTTLVINCVNFIDAPLYAAYCLKLPFKTFYPEILRYLASCTINIILVQLLKSFFVGTNNLLGIMMFGSLYLGVSLIITSILVLNKTDYQNINIFINKIRRRLRQ